MFTLYEVKSAVAVGCALFRRERDKALSGILENGSLRPTLEIFLVLYWSVAWLEFHWYREDWGFILGKEMSRSA